MGLKRAASFFLLLLLLFVAFNAIAQADNDSLDSDTQASDPLYSDSSEGEAEEAEAEPIDGEDQQEADPWYSDPWYSDSREPDPWDPDPWDNPEPGEMPIDSEWTGPVPELYSMGDRTFTLSAGLIIPTLFVNNRMEPYSHNLNLGGAGSLSFCYFLGAHFFVGGEIGGMFSQSLMNNFLYLIPIGARVGYQFIFRRFEFPLSLMIGISPTTYLDKNYLGLFVKPQASIFFRFNPDWSFGFNTAWWWVPQWTEDSSTSRVGNFLELTFSARYHF